MSTSAIDSMHDQGQLRKTVAVYLVLALTAIAVDHIYALFAHGVSSAAMTWMFLYPLIGGALAYFLIERLRPGMVRARGYRMFYNLYNSGIAALTAGSFVQGILEIAGTTSPYAVLFFISGGLLVAAGLAGLCRYRWSRWH